MSIYEIKDIDLAGRIAKIRTRHGILETPYLFPVVDPTRQEIELDVFKQLGFNGIITNAYILYRRTKGSRVSLHKFLNWNNVLMTDSGGYQVLVYGDIEVDNKTIVLYEIDIEPDIAVILDIPTGSHMDKGEASKAVEETFKRAVEALPLIQGTDMVWVLPIQGAPYRDLVVYSSIRAWRYPYHMYALGSPTVLLERYEYDKLIDIVALARLHMPPNKPLHVFGVGHPMIIPFLVALGADTFDSASYILYARDLRYMVEGGTKKLSELDYLPCSCPVCIKYTPKELYELPDNERVRLLALHNIYKLREEVNRVKIAIREGRLWELLESRSRMHPSLRSAFNTLKKYMDLLKKYTPFSKGLAQALHLYDPSSTYNPKIIVYRESIIKYVRFRGNDLVLLPAIKKPYRIQNYLDKPVVREELSKSKIFYHPIIGVIPWDLAETYPAFQHEEPVFIEESRELCIRVADYISDFIRSTGVSNVSIVVCKNVWWSKCLYEELVKKGLRLKQVVVTCT